MDIKETKLIYICTEDEDDFVGLEVKIANPADPTEDLLLRYKCIIMYDDYVSCEAFDQKTNQFLPIQEDDDFDDPFFRDDRVSGSIVVPVIDSLDPYVNVLRKDVLQQVLENHQLVKLFAIIHTIQADTWMSQSARENIVTFECAMYILKKLETDSITSYRHYAHNWDDLESVLVTDKIRKYYKEWTVKS